MKVALPKIKWLQTVKSVNYVKIKCQDFHTYIGLYGQFHRYETRRPTISVKDMLPD